jgi:hypothetical protein
MRQYKKSILCLHTVGKLKANSFESVMIKTGGATKFLTDRIIIRGIKQTRESKTAGSASGPKKEENKSIN